MAGYTLKPIYRIKYSLGKVKIYERKKYRTHNKDGFWEELYKIAKNGTPKDLNELCNKEKELGHTLNLNTIIEKDIFWGDQTAAMVAVNFGNIDVLKALINSGYKTEEHNPTGIRTLLLTALKCENKTIESTQLLLAHSISKNYIDTIVEYIQDPSIKKEYKYSLNLFIEAAKYQTPNKSEMMIKIIQAGYNITEADSEGLTIFHHMKKIPLDRDVYRLFSAKVDLYQQIIESDIQSSNELNYAAKNGDIGMVSFLLLNIYHHKPKMITHDFVGLILDPDFKYSKEIHYLLDRFLYISSGHKPESIKFSLSENFSEVEKKNLDNIIEYFRPSASTEISLKPCYLISEEIDNLQTSFSNNTWHCSIPLPYMTEPVDPAFTYSSQDLPSSHIWYFEH